MVNVDTSPGNDVDGNSSLPAIPLTCTPNNEPLVKPALSTVLPVACFVPTYMYTSPPVSPFESAVAVPLPVSSCIITMVLLPEAGFATRFSNDRLPILGSSNTLLASVPVKTQANARPYSLVNGGLVSSPAM